jgi:hypothetical protein
MLPAFCTFDYLAIVPDIPTGNSAPWTVMLRRPSKRKEALVGLSPTIQITDAGLTPDTPRPRDSFMVRPKVLRSEITLSASRKEGAGVSAASFHVDKSLTSALRPRDILHITRTGCGGLAVSVIRDDQLVVGVGAVTCVPLGSNVRARVPLDLVEKGEAVFKRTDPEFRFRELPIEIGVGRQSRVLYTGWIQLEDYEVYLEHGFYWGLPGTDECVAISRKGACSVTAANASAQLLDFSDALNLVAW